MDFSSRRTRKRLRSVTPSEGGVNGEGSRTQDVVRLPLAKRKKLVADRSGFSKLKEAITAEDLDEAGAEEVVELPPRSAEEELTEEGEGDEEDEEDDFLTRELGEEWG